MKTIYFLRHGQTELNRSWLHQYPETMLSAKGIEQAKTVAHALKDVQFDLVISSTLLRAVQTAQEVMAYQNCTYKQSDLFIELRRPHELWGVHWAHPRSLYIMGLLYMRAKKENWHFSDEENLEEFHARARRVLEYLADRPEKTILVVTHRGFMAALRERMLRDGLDTVAQYRRSLWKNLSIKNCCYMKTTWTTEGSNGNTLDGTWSVEKDIVCPIYQIHKP